jgi:hypothetical protein
MSTAAQTKAPSYSWTGSGTDWEHLFHVLKEKHRDSVGVWGNRPFLLTSPDELRTALGERPGPEYAIGLRRLERRGKPRAITAYNLCWYLPTRHRQVTA